MSHVVGVSCEVRDLDALEQACANKGATFVRDQKSHAYYGGAREKCDHAIKVPGCTYEIGVRRNRAQADEVYDLRYDNYDRSLDRVFGANLEGLQNEYLAVVAERQLSYGRYRLEREAVEGDPHAIRLVARA